MSTSPFSSVKLPSGLVDQARQAAQPMRRSVAGQIEYWATLGRIVEASGLTAQEALEAIARHDALLGGQQQAALPEAVADEYLDELEARFVAAEASGALAQRVRAVVEANRQQAAARRVA